MVYWRKFTSYLCKHTCETIRPFTKIILIYTQNGISSHLLYLISVPINVLLRKIFGTAFFHTNILKNGRKWMENRSRYLELLKSSYQLIFPLEMLLAYFKVISSKKYSYVFFQYRQQQRLWVGELGSWYLFIFLDTFAIISKH